ncbi:hypothetical protein CEUSTIGMA_g2114.t1 [Chlamydomonas eustigma]|uniref:FAST kinase leucine-rich domain-containing protein n=1 Tax=Chlamydomonas eustigma TaxID=1157962 RepID=A0A250WV81_9CHLO|nr:hypothetical protein CEUSTIGMA_g2114.t1 [Chlamydomonas eustigma]|eukprot:GAX74666.1 hypothetical protein CEUSTIGMA_g2114.t1 [Chlamydomonas eustigma]
MIISSSPNPQRILEITTNASTRCNTLWLCHNSSSKARGQTRGNGAKCGGISNHQSSYTSSFGRAQTLDAYEGSRPMQRVPMQRVPMQRKVPMDAALLTFKLRHCDSPQQVLELFSNHRDGMDFIHLSAAITRLANLANSSTQPSSHVLQDPDVMYPSQRSGHRNIQVDTSLCNTHPQSSQLDYASLTNHLIQDLLSHKRLMRAREVSNVVWALCKLGYNLYRRPLEELLGEVPRIAVSCKGQEISSLLYSLAAAGRRLDGRDLNTVWSGKTVEYEQSGSDRTGESDIDELNHTTGSKGIVPKPQPRGKKPPAWTPEMADHVECAQGGSSGVDLQACIYSKLEDALLNGELRLQALSNTMWALGKQVQLGGVGPPQGVCRSLILATSKAAHQLSPLGLCNVVVGLAWLQLRPGGEWTARYHDATLRSLGSLGGQGLANILWAFVTLGRPPPVPWMTTFIMEVERRLHQKADFPLIPDSPGKLDRSQTSFHDGVGITQEYSSTASDIRRGDNGGIDQNSKQSKELLSKFLLGSQSPPNNLAHSLALNPTDICFILRSLARLGFKPPAPMLDACLGSLYSCFKEKSMTPQALANISTALAAIGARPTEVWIEGLLRASYVQGPGFTSQGADMLLTSLEDMGFKPSKRIVARLSMHLPEDWRQRAKASMQQRSLTRAEWLQEAQCKREERRSLNYVLCRLCLF